jgi:DDE family transposase
MPEIESAEKRQGLHLACFTRTVVESKRNSPAPTVKTAFRCESRASRSTNSEKRKQAQKKRWFKKAQKWRTGCEGRIRVLKRRHGLNRSRYKGVPGVKRWVGLGVIADNMINIGLHLAGKR